MKNTKSRHRMLLRVGSCVLALATPAFAGLDLHDYDDDLMRDLDRTIKVFEPDITAQNAAAAKEDAAILLEGFRYTEDYFGKKGVADAVAISRDGSRLVDAVLRNVDKGDFDAAATAARDAPQLCKSCHDLYKPRLGR
ncbi:hypothetical protein A8B73_11595 [Methylosinus sp. 3S-1]|nr:hypothetical protein A8B73_11595 [Methylosinus sp. 3S-1]